MLHIAALKPAPTPTPIGTRSGKLEVIGHPPRRGTAGMITVLCRCECGAEVIHRATDVRCGRVKSCRACSYRGLSPWTEARKEALPGIWRDAATLAEVRAALSQIDAPRAPPALSRIAEMAGKMALPPRAKRPKATATGYKPPPPKPMAKPVRGEAANREEAFALAMWKLSKMPDLGDVDVDRVAFESGLRRFTGSAANREVRVAIGLVRVARHEGAGNV